MQQYFGNAVAISEKKIWGSAMSRMPGKSIADTSNDIGLHFESNACNTSSYRWAKLLRACCLIAICRPAAVAISGKRRTLSRAMQHYLMVSVLKCAYITGF